MNIFINKGKLGCIFKSTKKAAVPGWTEQVKTHIQPFWHNLCKENGSPRSGNISNIRNCTMA